MYQQETKDCNDTRERKETGKNSQRWKHKAVAMFVKQRVRERLGEDVGDVVDAWHPSHCDIALLL